MPSAAFKKALATAEKKAENAIKDVNKAGIIKRVILDSPRLNYIYGGGVAIGRVHRMIGPESGGKSTILTYIAGQFQKHLKEQQGMDKPYCVYIDFERTFDKDHANEIGLNTDEDHFVLMQPDDIESAGAVLEELVKTGEVGTVILDSESMGTTKTLNEKEVGTANFGNYAKVFSDFLKRFVTLCANYESTLFIVSQERANMQMMSHAISTTGGFMLRYAGSTLMRVRKIENIKEGSKDVGIYMNVRNIKNKTGIPWRDCEMMLYFDKGFRSDLEYADFIKEFNGDPRLANYVSIGGAYYKSEEFGFSICGKEKFLEWANNFENAEKWQKIKDIITEIISHPTPIDTDIDTENMTEEEIEELKKEGKLKTLEVNKDNIEDNTEE